MKAKRSNELVKVVAHNVTYGVRDDHLHTSISGFEIRQQDEPPALTDSRIAIEFGPTVLKTAATNALRMVLAKIEADDLPSLVMTMEKRAATRLLKLQKDAAKASKMLTKLPEEVRADVKRILTLDI
jgi:DNA polymerase III sliding clamp (beta) subunit (PCNA family)